MSTNVATRTRHDLGPVAQVPFGEGRAFVVAGDQIAIFRLRDGSLRAVSAVCPHKGGPLSQGIVHGCKVTCPLHNFVIDLRSGGAVAPDEGRTRTVPARRNGDRVEISVSGSASTAVLETEYA